MRKSLWLAIGGALLLAGSFAVWEFCFDLSSRLEMNDPAEFRRGLLENVWQFLLIAVLGGALGLFYRALEGEREWRAARMKSLLRTRAELVRAYNEVKAIRRLLRASASEKTGGEVFVCRDEYNSLMRRLLKAQLEFEYYEELVKSDRQFFPQPAAQRTQLEKAGAALNEVENYLNKIVGEFEKAWTIFAEADKAPLEKFKYLKEFVEKSEDNEPFDARFKEPFRKALELIESAAEDLSVGLWRERRTRR